MRIFELGSDPDYIFGPIIEVTPDAMTYATMEIIKWKERSGGMVTDVMTLVDRLNEWATVTYVNTYDHRFLRVMWGAKSNCRHPKEPGPDSPDGSRIEMLGW